MSEHRRHPPEDADRRHLEFEMTELRVEERDDEPTRIVGYAAVFEKRSEDLGGFVEVLEPGAFRDALPNSQVVGLFNHAPDNLLASQESGRLTLEEDERGLRFEMEPVDTAVARDVMKWIESGDLTGNSFSFRVKEDGDEVDRDADPPVRKIKSGGIKELFDVGPVTFPAYRDTVVSTRSVESVRPEEQAEESDEGSVETFTVRLDVDASELREKLAELHRLAETIYGRLPENRQSRPDFDGTEDVEPAWADGAWGRPDLSDHPEAGEDDWDDLDEDARESIAGRFIVGTAGAETYVDLAYPVVNPATDNLNRNGLLAARQRASAEDDSEVAGIADALWGDFYADEDEGDSADVDDRLRLARLEVAEMDAEMAGSSG